MSTTSVGFLISAAAGGAGRLVLTSELNGGAIRTTILEIDAITSSRFEGSDIKGDRVMCSFHTLSPTNTPSFSTTEKEAAEIVQFIYEPAGGLPGAQELLAKWLRRE